MKFLPVIMLAVASLGSAAFADETDRSAFLPIAEKVNRPDVSIDRSQTRTAAIGWVALAPASPADIDANGDGRISFDELLGHHLNNGF